MWLDRVWNMSRLSHLVPFFSLMHTLWHVDYPKWLTETDATVPGSVKDYLLCYLLLFLNSKSNEDESVNSRDCPSSSYSSAPAFLPPLPPPRPLLLPPPHTPPQLRALRILHAYLALPTPHKHLRRGLTLLSLSSSLLHSLLSPTHTHPLHTRWNGFSFSDIIPEENGFQLSKIKLLRGSSPACEYIFKNSIWEKKGFQPHRSSWC